MHQLELGELTTYIRLRLLPHLVHSMQSLAGPPISSFHVPLSALALMAAYSSASILNSRAVPSTTLPTPSSSSLLTSPFNDAPASSPSPSPLPPCAHCRQFFQELRHSTSLQILITDQENCIRDLGKTENLESRAPDSVNPLSKILPNPFGPSDLVD